jgi:hypothetical protein
VARERNGFEYARVPGSVSLQGGCAYGEPERVQSLVERGSL